MKNKGFRLPILTYHHISSKIDYYTSVSFSTFRKQVQKVMEKYQYIDLNQAYSLYLQGKDLVNKFSISFDDGYQDIIPALKYLSSKNARALLFIPTSTIGTDNRWNYKATYFANILTKSQIRKILEQGHLIGSHGKTHQCLTKLTREEIKEEVFESKEYLEKLTKQDVNFFAYPYGFHNSKARQIVAKYYRAAFATNKTAKGISWDNGYSIYRFSVNRDTTMREIEDYLSVSYAP